MKDSLTLFSLFFALFALIQLGYYFYYFLRLVNYQSVEFNKEQQAVSIVIAAKNEAANIPQNLTLILQQDYSQFEVIVVNDHSNDTTEEELQKFKAEKLRYFNLEGDSGKKAAIAYGIEQAQFEYILLTDADCRPASDYWIKGMMDSFSNGIELVLGHGRFEKSSGPLNAMIRFENLLNAMQCFSFAIKGDAYMGIGRNLAYTKSLFQRSSSFERHSDIASGDDDLLVNEMSTSNNVGIAISAHSHTFSLAESSWNKYFHQRRRQLQAGRKYKVRHQFLLALYGTTNVLYYVLLVSLLLFSTVDWVILGIFVFKQIVAYFVFYSAAKKLGERDLVFWLPLLEPIYLLNICLVGISTYLWSVKKWK